MAATPLLYKTVRGIANTARISRRQPALKVAFILGFLAVFEGGLWAMFAWGLAFIDSLGSAGYMILRRLFALFFVGLGMMLAASSLVTAYATMYRSRETEFLLCQPLSFSRIAVHKFCEAAFISSWAFFFIIVPFIGAYGAHQKMTLAFTGLTLLFAVPFLLVCSGIGTLLAMAIVRWSPRGRFLRLFALAAFVALSVRFVTALARQVGDTGQGSDFVLTALVPGLKLACNPLLPSWWTSEGMLCFAEGDALRGLMLWLVLASNAALLWMAVEWAGARIFYPGWLRSRTGGGRGARAGVGFGLLDRALSPLPRDVAAIVMKDVRSFFRDAAQWSQALVFFGLLVLYFVNLRNFRYQNLPQEWRSLIAFLNVFGVASVLNSLTSRFVFPQLSLEGQAFWIIGLSPTPLRRVLMTKFWLSLCAMLLISVALIALSSLMLGVERRVTALAVAVVAAIACAATGLSTGLGAVFMDLKERNPSAIVSGFGGTVNLVLSLAFMICAILPFAVVFHLQFLGRIAAAQANILLTALALWLALITAVAVAVPLSFGIRRLARMEF